MRKNTKRTIVKTSIASTLAIAAISPIAVALGKQIIDEQQNNLFNNLSRNVQNKTWTNIPDINKATNKMFTNTSYLTYLGTLAKGPAVTPYGWLGTYSQQTSQKVDNDFRNFFWDNTLALVGWDGSIIWAQNPSNIKINNVKYNFTNDLLFTIATQDITGIGINSQNINLYIQDAKTGKTIFSPSNGNGIFEFHELIDPNFLHGQNVNYEFVWTEENKKDLFFQDCITLTNGDIIWYYLPNPLKIRVKNKTTNNISNLLTTYQYYRNILGVDNTVSKHMGRIFHIKKTDIDAAKNSTGSITLNDITDTVLNNYKYSNSNNKIIAPPIFVPAPENQFNIYTYLIPNDSSEIKVTTCVLKINTTTNQCEFVNGDLLDGASQYNSPANFNIYKDSSAISSNHVDKILTEGTGVQWSDEFNQALLVPVRNIFDEYSVTFAYPYASPGTSNSSNVKIPIFNVLSATYKKTQTGNARTIHYEPSKTKLYDFGSRIIKKYIDDRGWQKNPVIQSGTTLLWYPWPGSAQSLSGQGVNINSYTNQLYSRLISVSPFDNTILYAARPDNIHATGSKDDLLGFSSSENEFASFWIGDPKTGNIKNFWIPNSSSLYQSTISNELVTSSNTIKTIYNTGFWFDVNSLSNTSYNNTLNLYFYPTGSKRDYVAFNSIKTSPISVIRVNASTSKPMDTLTNASNANKISISNDSYINYITSRADLNLWFNRTYQNLTKGANTYQDGDVLNDYNITDTNRPTVESKFNTTLTGQYFGPNNKSVELFTYWNASNNRDNYNSMAVKRAKIVAKPKTNQLATNSLDVELQFIVDHDNTLNNPHIDTAQKSKATTFSFPVTIQNTSWQLLDAWSTNLKLDSFSQTNNTNDFNTQIKVMGDSTTPVQGNYGSTFGTHNLGYWTKNGNSWTWQGVSGSIFSNNTDSPLRVEYGIDLHKYMTEASGDYFTRLSSHSGNMFTKTYPVGNTGVNGETSFNAVLDEFVKWKAANLEYGTVDDPTKSIYSPGQICIKAYVKLNPHFSKTNVNINSTIYSLDTTQDPNTNVMYDSRNEIRYIYKNETPDANKIVYNLNSTQWNDNMNSGFGTDVTNSWVTIPNSNNKKLIAYLKKNGQTNDATVLKDTLLRDGTTTTTDKMFSAKYNDDNSAIILTVNSAHKDWVRKRFSSFNQMVGRNLKFQYLLVGDDQVTQSWQYFDPSTSLSDAEGKQIFATGDTYTIPFKPSGNVTELPKTIQKIRLVLNSIPTSGDTWVKNKIVDSSDLDSNPAFTSNSITLDSIRINADYDWISTQTPLNTNAIDKYLNGPGNNQLTETDFQTIVNSFEQSVITQAGTVIKELKDKIKLKYSLTNNADENSPEWVDNTGLYNLLKTYWETFSNPNSGILNLYDETTNNKGTDSKKIYVKFVIKNEVDKDKFVINEVNKERNYVKSTNIKFFINLKSYKDVLSTEKTSVISGTTENSITSFTPPAMTSNNQFLSGKTYDEIITTLSKFGISVEYQKTDGSWTPNRNEITSYDPNTRQLKIKFKISNSNYNVVASVDGTTAFNLESTEIALQLNVPILIKLTEGVRDNFVRKENIFTGNNWTLNIDSTKAKTIITDIQNDGKVSATNPDDKALWDQIPTLLEIQYALSETEPANGNSGWYNETDFKNHLKAQNDTNYSNTIWARLHLKNQGSDPKFIIAPGADKPFKMNNRTEANFQPNNNKIKIYVHAKKYEDALDNIAVVGSTSDLSFTYPQPITDIITNTSLGIKIQYSLNQNINYNDNNNTNDIKTGWVDQAPTSIPLGTQSLKVRIIVTDANNFEYGMGNQTGDPKVHSVDLTQISQLVDVDVNWFKNQSLTTGYLKDIDDSIVGNWIDSVLNTSSALQTDPTLKDKIEIKFQIEGNQNWYTKTTLVTELKAMISRYSDSSLGIVYLWDGARGIKINAKFEKKNQSDKIIFVTGAGSSTPNDILEGEIKTSEVKTYIDLTSYVNVLQSNKTSVVLNNGQAGTIQSFTPPKMTGNKGDSFLSGYTYDEIEKRLKDLGITIKFNNNLDTNWNEKSAVTTYDQNKPVLYLGFEYEQTTKPNITIKINSTNNTEIQDTKLEKNLITLQLLAPVAIQVDLTKLDQLAFQGNTKQISNKDTIPTNVTTIVNEIQTNHANVIDASDFHLEIRFSLKEIKLEDTISDQNATQDGIWYTFDKLNSILSTSTKNYNTNAVYAKFFIKDNPQIDGVNKYILSNTGYQVINQENLTAASSFKVYINNTEQTQEAWIKTNLTLKGSQENFTINGLDTWKTNLPQGLEVEYNAKANTTDPSQPDDQSWKTIFSDASPIDSMRNYWIRFKVKDAYVFEGALQNNAQYSQAFKLDASQIQVALKVKAEWLNQITLSGNLKTLTINETNAMNQVTTAGMMPINNIIQIEYTFDNVNWYIKDTFTANLEKAAGAKDSSNWIILREDIKARFSLNASVNANQNPKYLLEVDGTNIDENNENNAGVNLITETLNNGVKGYVNLDKLTPYKASNFSVTGTDAEAFLNIKQYNELNRLITPYSTNPLFSILYKYQENGTYDDVNKVWTPGTDLTSSIPLKGNYSARYFGMQFKVTNTNYELYKNGTKQTGDAYEFATNKQDPDKIDIKISVAIVNPLSSNEIDIKFLTADNKAQWYNGSGAFTIQISKASSTGQGTQIFTSFQNFLTTWATSWPQDQREALDLVYYVARDANEEIKQQAIANLSTYVKNSTEKYDVWKSINDSAVANLNYNLKVNDFVMLAVRIKEEKLTSESNPNGYVLKDSNHSPTDLIRAFGYKVHTDNIDVDWATLKVRNVDAAESASYGLDGYAMLDQVNLKRAGNDATSDDYLNVSLQLNYFTEFYYNDQDKVLVSGDGSRLVKRDSNGAEVGDYYKAADGQDVVDKEGHKVQILYQAGQKENGILAKPIKAQAVQRSHKLIETTTNSYTLELNNGEENALYSFFKFQDIAIQFTNKKGAANPDDPDVFDYYVDKENIAKDYTINSQIKFPIQNNNLIHYSFNSEEFINYIKDQNNILNVYENILDPSKRPVNGQSKLKYMYKVTRTEGQNPATTELTTVTEIMNKIKEDFGTKVILKTTYTPVNGAATILTNNELSSINSLSNGDRFRIEIVSADENNLIFAQQPSPLVFTVSGLYEADIEEEYLQYLRVQQSGNFNGEGKFEIFVDNPYDDADNHISVSTLLQGYKFMVRVWDSNKAVKQEWTTDYESINNLTNGDKVEWKLVAPTGAPVEKAYYNTVANLDQHDSNNNRYSFSQVAKIGNATTTVIANTIGLNPTTDTYPENTGLLISGLTDKISDTYTSITEEEFIRLMNVMNFGYTGINGQGNMVSERDITTIVVNTSGLTRQEYTFKYLVDQGYLTFFSNDVEFTWNQVKDNNGNWLISPGTLSNGEQIKIKYQDPTMSAAYVWEAPEVSGLKDKSDSMSLLAYVGIGMASFATLGLFALIYFRARNKKLRK